MPTYRAVVRKAHITDEIVEVESSTLRNAAATVDAYARGEHRRVRVIRPHDADPDPVTEIEVREIKER